MITLHTEHGISLVPEDYLRELVQMDDELLTVADLVSLTKFSERKVLDMLRDQRIPGYKVCGEWRITRPAYRRAAEIGFPHPGKRSSRHW